MAAFGLVTFVTTAANAGRDRDRDCGDLSTQAAAQAFMNTAGPGDPHGLDGSGPTRQTPRPVTTANTTD